MLNQKDIRRRFERAAHSFDAADFVHAATRNGLLTRLQPLLIDAKTIVDLGAATGAANRPLLKRFKGASVVSIDLAHGMLREARDKKKWLSKVSFIQADAVQLPLKSESVDLVFSNLLLPWVDDQSRLFDEVARVLKKGGVFAFATLGPDSLQEIGRAWRQVDDGRHVHHFLDMHHLGDGLVAAGLRDPVLDVDRLAIRYKDSRRLFEDLTAVGARNSLRERAPGLTGRQRFGTMIASLNDGEGDIELELELVFGHCWGGGPKIDPLNYRIDASAIPLRRK